MLVAGALAGARSINEMAIEAFAEVGPTVLHISGERDYWSLKSRITAGRLPADPVDRPDRRSLLGLRPRGGARGQLRLGDRGN